MLTWLVTGDKKNKQILIQVFASSCMWMCHPRRKYMQVARHTHIEPRTKDQWPRTVDPGLKTQDWRPRTEDWGPRTKDPGLKTQDWRLRTKDQGPRTKDQGPRTKDWQLGIKDSGWYFHKYQGIIYKILLAAEIAQCTLSWGYSVVININLFAMYMYV